MTSSDKRNLVETLRNDYSVHQICETLGFNRSLLYYHPKSDPSEEGLGEEIEKLCARYPKYGYRRITQMLLGMGYTVGYRRVARLMKSQNLSVSVKGVSSQTTRSLEGAQPWVNRLEALDICRCDQVWVGDITYVRLHRRFVYVWVAHGCLHSHDKRVAGEPPFEHISDPESIRIGITPKYPRDPP